MSSVTSGPLRVQAGVKDFALTPALSLEERENRRPRLCIPYAIILIAIRRPKARPPVNATLLCQPA